MFKWLTKSKNSIVPTEGTKFPNPKSQGTTSKLLNLELVKSEPVRRSEASKFVHCSHKRDQGYVIRLRKQESDWELYDVAAVGTIGNAEATSSVGDASSDTRIENYCIAPNVATDCPCCGARNFFKCTCGEYSCIHDDAPVHVCPACSLKITSFGKSNGISAGIDKRRKGSSLKAKEQSKAISNGRGNQRLPRSSKRKLISSR